MQDTKERILREALRLFSCEGYEAVSMRDIAGRLGITQSALYKHYSGKQDIFESIVRRMQEQDAERAREYEVPQDSFAVMADAYRDTGLEQLGSFAFAQFIYWTQDDFAANFRRMLTLEQYRSPERSAMYQQYLCGGIIDYTEDIFRESGVGGGKAPRALALEFFAPIYMLMSLYDCAQDKQGVTAQVREHIDSFIREKG